MVERDRASSGSHGPTVSTELLDTVEALLRRGCGFRFGEVQRRSLHDALQRRLAATGDAAASYRRRLEAAAPTGGELAALLAEFTNTETHFFRHAGRFELLRTVVLPELVRRRLPGSKLRILSAGCASGEEVYSAIMAALDVEHLWRGYSLEATGCDINERALRRARTATYGRWTLRYTPQRLLEQYFRPLDEAHEQWAVRERVTRHASFRHRNLVDPRLGQEPTLQSFDVVFCCNVMIYLDDEVVERLMGQLCSLLDEGGFLFVGYTESLHARRRDFEPIWCDDYVVYRRRTGIEAQGAGPSPSRERARRLERRASVPGRNGSARPRPAAAPPRAGAATTPGPGRATPPGARVAALPTLPNRRAEPEHGIDAWYEAAVGHCRADRPHEAACAIERVLESQPFHLRGRLVRAYLHGSGGDFWAAVAECTKALDIEPLCASAYLLLGMLLEQQGELTSSLRETKRALYLDPDLPLAYFNLGKLYRSLDQPQAAAREFANAVRLLEAQPGLRVAGDVPVEIAPEVLLQLARQQRS